MDIRPSGWGGPIKEHSEGLRNGEAIVRHQNVAHNGNFDPDCPACQELVQKVEEFEQFSG